MVHITLRPRQEEWGVMGLVIAEHSESILFSSMLKFFIFLLCRGGCFGNCPLLDDQVAFEESKEADTSSGKATHRVVKGLHNKVN